MLPIVMVAIPAIVFLVVAALTAMVKVLVGAVLVQERMVALLLDLLVLRAMVVLALQTPIALAQTSPMAAVVVAVCFTLKAAAWVDLAVVDKAALPVVAPKEAQERRPQERPIQGLVVVVVHDAEGFLPLQGNPAAPVSS